jgi:non-specific serine/threonine protein kinase
MVELGGLRDPSLLTQEVARGLGLHDASIRWAVDALAQHVGERRLLLVLDNCEHLLDACAVLVDSLARSSPNLHVLATSRQSLGIAGETVFRVPPLSVPGPGSCEGEAVELLAARAASVLSGRELDAGQREAAADLCRRLDGIPLAIELAAVRLKTLTIEQILDRLGDRFAVLGEGERGAPPHRRTLRTALDWSYALTTDEERSLWQRLAVFPGTFDLAAVEAVCAGDPPQVERVLHVLDGLVDKSVVSAIRSGPEMRYRMLEGIRCVPATATPTPCFVNKPGSTGRIPFSPSGSSGSNATTTTSAPPSIGVWKTGSRRSAARWPPICGCIGKREAISPKDAAG